MLSETIDIVRIKKQEDLFLAKTLFRPLKRRTRQGSFFKSRVLSTAFILIVAAGFTAPIQITLLRSGAAEEVVLGAPDFVEAEAQLRDFGQLPVALGLGDRYISVSLAEQKMQAYENGERVMEAAVSTGAKNYPTPQGVFAIKNKAPMAYSRAADLYMPYWMAFTKFDGHYLGFHELPQHSDGTKEGAEHLGQPYSGGCIRLGVGAAEKFYNWAQVGDKVVVY